MDRRPITFCFRLDAQNKMWTFFYVQCWIYVVCEQLSSSSSEKTIQFIMKKILTLRWPHLNENLVEYSSLFDFIRIYIQV